MNRENCNTIYTIIYHIINYILWFTANKFKINYDNIIWPMRCYVRRPPYLHCLTLKLNDADIPFYLVMDLPTALFIWLTISFTCSVHIQYSWNICYCLIYLNNFHMCVLIELVKGSPSFEAHARFHIIVWGHAPLTTTRLMYD